MWDLSNGCGTTARKVRINFLIYFHFNTDQLFNFLLFFSLRLPKQKSNVDPAVVGEVFIDRLSDKRDHITGINRCTRKKKLNVPAGKGITPDDLINENLENSRLEEENADDPSSPPTSTPRTTTKKRAPKRKLVESSTSGKKRGPKRKLVESSDESSMSESEENESSSAESESESSDSDSDGTPRSLHEADDYHVKDFVIVYYPGDGGYYPGQITKTSDYGATVKCLEKINGTDEWRWPKKVDKLEYEWRLMKRKATKVTTAPTTARNNRHRVRFAAEAAE